MDIKSLLSLGNWVFCHKTLIKKYDSDTAIIIGYLCNQQEQFQDWFYCTYSKIEEELGIKEYTIRKCIQKLIEDGILFTERQGLPCRTYYLINEEELTEIFTGQVLTKTKGQATVKTKGQATVKTKGHIYNKTILNKNLINKTILNKNILLSQQSCDGEIVNNFSNTLKDKNGEFFQYAEKLAQIIQTQKNITVSKNKLNAWANSIRLLNQQEKVPINRIDAALNWYENNVGGDYVPVVESGASFREKFTRLEDAMKRQNKPIRRNNVGSLSNGQPSSIDYSKVEIKTITRTRDDIK